MPQDGIYNARIEGASLSASDYGAGYLTGTVTVKYEGWHQSFGAYCLFNEKTQPEPGYEKFCGRFLTQVMKVAGVTEWAALGSQAIRVQIEGGSIKAIGHFMDDTWFDPKIPA